jgi:hypothetical protein
VARVLDNEAPAAQPVLRAVLREAVTPELARGEKSCRCGHGKRAHQHYRRGTDCALCGCGSFSRPWLTLLRPGR